MGTTDCSGCFVQSTTLYKFYLEKLVIKCWGREDKLLSGLKSEEVVLET